MSKQLKHEHLHKLVTEKGRERKRVFGIASIDEW